MRKIEGYFEACLNLFTNKSVNMQQMPFTAKHFENKYDIIIEGGVKWTM